MTRVPKVTIKTKDLALMVRGTEVEGRKHNVQQKLLSRIPGALL